MKVLIVSEPGVDGVFRHVEGLVRYLLRQKVTVALAYSSRRGGDRLQALVVEMNGQGAATLDLEVGNSPGPADALALFRLAKLAHSFQPDAIHGHSSKGGALARALKVFGVKARYFYSAHAYFGMNGKKGLRTNLYNGIEKKLGGIGHTINMSKSEAAFALEIVKIKKSQQLFVFNGVDTAHFVPVSREKRHQLRMNLNLPLEAHIFGTVGRTSAQKDPLTIYRALEIALKTEPNLHLAHLGRGELDEEINNFVSQNRLTSNVHRFPYLSDPVPFYQALDSFALSSIYEGMSYAVLETMSVNLPLVLSSCPGNIDFGDFGLSHIYWNTPRNPNELAESLLRCYADSLKTDRQINHRQIAMERFSEDTCFGQMLAAYRG